MMGELMNQMLAGGPGEIPVKDLTEQQQTLLRELSSFSADSVAHVLSPIALRIIAKVARYPAVMSDSEPVRESFMRHLMHLSRLTVLACEETPFSEASARVILAMLGHGPSFVPSCFSRAFCVAVVAQHEVWGAALSPVGSIIAAMHTAIPEEAI